MCVINITLNSDTPNGTTIASSNGRYRKNGQTTWNNFSISLNDPKTPNITELGQYELQVNVTNNLGVVSDWALGNFSITNDCGVVVGDPVVTPVPTTSNCTTWFIGTSSPLITEFDLEVHYVDCDGVETITFGNDKGKFICAQYITYARLGQETFEVNSGPYFSGDFSNEFGSLTSQESC